MSGHNSWPRSASQDHSALWLLGVVIFISKWRLFRVVVFPQLLLSRLYADHPVDETRVGGSGETI